MKQVVMAGAFPDLGVHDDRAVEARHFVGRGGPGRLDLLVMSEDHVAPPGLADIAFQFDAEGTVVPESLNAAVDFARLKQETSPFAQRNQFVHVHRDRPRMS